MLTNAPAKKLTSAIQMDRGNKAAPWKHLAPETSTTLLAARRVNAVHAILLDCCRNVDPGETALFQPSHFSRKRLDLVSTDFRLLLISPFVTKALNARD
jgi:hypothetical protein